MLALIEFVLQKYGIGYLRYDGGTKYSERKEILDEFKRGHRKKVLLISLKCGALGLNLMAANHVIFIDLWWNPAIEAQAVDRVHRIGQKKHVHITRIVIRDSVQDRMMEIQREKQDTADFALLGAKALNSSSGESVRILRRLFGGGKSDNH